MNEQEYTHEDLINLSDEELYEILYNAWGITNKKIEVWGELRLNSKKNWAGLYDVYTVENNTEISYPEGKVSDEINDLSGIEAARYAIAQTVKKNIQDGVYLNFADAEKFLGNENSSFIKCNLILSPKKEREKQQNPFALMVDPKSIKKLKALPSKSQYVLEKDTTEYIYENIYNFHLNNVNKKIQKERNTHQQKINEIQRNIDKKTEELNYTNNKNKLLEADNIDLENTIIKQKMRQEREFTDMEQKIKNLEKYIADKEKTLLDLKLIDEKILNNHSELPKSEVIAFDGDYKNAVSHIQTYLREQGSLYPRHIIENYLTLIRTNDLIILAGDSGSGKTSLVTAFAKAIGGISKIIPVKPNWTSSEDLLGYYNPLEKKYLATSFLEALIEARNNPETPYFICLDEMNLARVEYYFADFLSILEKRDKQPEIQLYADTESTHILFELQAVIEIITNAKEKFSKNGIVDFIKLMQDDDINTEMKRAFGFSDKDSLIKYHGDIRRMLSGVLDIPSTLELPPNVRIIGAINIDETTHYLSPKILDRVHVMKFTSPLLSDWDAIDEQIKDYRIDNVDKPLFFNISELGFRQEYPKYDSNNDFCKQFKDLNKEFFNPLGIEFGMRAIRQGLNYLKLFSDVNDDDELAINNFILHKILPKFTFDGNKKSGNDEKIDIIKKRMLPELEKIIFNHAKIADEFSVVKAVEKLVTDAKSNDGIVNYWS